MKNSIDPRGGLPTHDELNKMILGALQRAEIFMAG